MKRQTWCRIVSVLILLAIITVLPACKKGVKVRPGAATETSLAGDNATINFNFPKGTVNLPANVLITDMPQSSLPVSIKSRSMGIESLIKNSINYNPDNVYIAAFTISVSPFFIKQFNVPVIMSGTVPASLAAGTTLNLAKLENNAWEDVLTLLVGANGALTQNFVSVNLPGIIGPGTYVLYKPAPGTSTAISNLGIVLIADDGNGSENNGGSGYLQVVHIYDANQQPLATPTISYLNYSSQPGDLDGQALTPDGSQGIMVDGGNTLLFFSEVQTGIPIASDTPLDVSAYGGDGDSVAIMPNGDEAVVSLDEYTLLLVSGIESGNPQPAKLIDLPDYRDGVVISNDGKVLLARGGAGLTVFSIASVTPAAGPLGGTVSHSFTQITDLTTLGSGTEDGRDGMAISPIDSSRAVLINSDSTAILLTGLPNSPNVGTPVALTGGYSVYSVAITPDGTTAIVGTDSGIIKLSGVNTGKLAMAGTIFAPTYTAGSGSVKLGEVKTLGVTLDGRYVVACDANNYALLVIPITAKGFGDPVGILTDIAVPDNDQLVIH